MNFFPILQKRTNRKDKRFDVVEILKKVRNVFKTIYKLITVFVSPVTGEESFIFKGNVGQILMIKHLEKCFDLHLL